MTLLTTVELVALGAFAGGMGALLGVGGGLVLVPALVLIARLPMHVAVGTSLACVVATSVAGSAVQFARGQVDVASAVRLQFFAVAGAVVGSLLAPGVPGALLYIGFAGMLLVVAWRTWPTGVSRPPAPPRARRASIAPVGSLGAGLVSSLLGVGGGIVFTPLLHLGLGLDFHRAAATSVYLIGVTAGSGALVYFVRGDALPQYAAPALLGILLGATLASAWSHRIDARWLKRAFALLLVYVAVRMILRGVRGG